VDAAEEVAWNEWLRWLKPTAATALMQTKNATPPAKTNASLHNPCLD